MSIRRVNNFRQIKLHYIILNTHQFLLIVNFMFINLVWIITELKYYEILEMVLHF